MCENEFSADLLRRMEEIARQSEGARKWVEGVLRGLPQLSQLPQLPADVLRKVELAVAKHQRLAEAAEKGPLVMVPVERDRPDDDLFDPTDVLAEAIAKGLRKAQVNIGDDPPPGETGLVNWDDYRAVPGGPLLTAEQCLERFAISGSVLSKASKAEGHKSRKKNPKGGSGYVYRYDFVSRISNTRESRGD